MPYVKPKIAREALGITDDTLRAWARDGRIKCIYGRGRNRLYDIESATNTHEETEKENFIYCRVSSNKQKEDLERQVEYLKNKYPNHTVCKEIASGLNFKRKGLQKILDKVISGGVGEIVVAHRDRLCRIAWEHFSWLFKRTGVNIVVDSEDETTIPETELAEDLLSIIHVFSCRHYGQRRKYTSKDIQKSVSPKPEEEKQSDNSEVEEAE